MLKLIALRLSSNPNATVSEDGKFNVTSDGRFYLMGEFENPENPFGGIVRRMIAQQFDSTGEPYWKVNLAGIKASIGKVVAGSIETHEVEPYEIGDRTVNTYTAVVFAHENLTTVFRNAGHPLASELTEDIEETVVDEVVEELSQPAPKPVAKPATKVVAKRR
jgi:hypothetical protein